MNCTLNGTTEIQCFQTIGGLSKIWVILYDDIDQYTYTNDNLNFISGYSVAKLPVTYNINTKESSFTGKQSDPDFKHYENELNVVIQRLSEDMRSELIALEGKDLTIIFKDLNGNCWIMGQHSGVKLTSNSLKTGVRGGISQYDLTFSSNERQHARRIECPSDGCFTSFRGLESNATTFTIPNSSNFGWDYLETDINEVIVTLDLTLPGQQSLDPSVWNTDPIVLAYDRLKLTELFSSNGAIVNNLTTTHNDMSDTTTIIIDSPNTAYGTFQLDNTVFNKDSFTAVLNLKTILSTGIANASSIIEVVDAGMNVVYSGGYGNILIGPNISGTTNDATLIMSNLYPNGTTLTISLTNVSCSDVSYTYNYKNTLQACGLTRTYNFNKGQLERFKILTPSTPVGVARFQNIHINMFGVVFTLYTNYVDWHSDFNQFETDIRNLFNQVQLSIDISSLVFTDTPSGIEVEFYMNGQNTNASNPYFVPFVRSFDQPVNPDVRWNQSRVLNIDTIGPVGSTITHTSGVNSISGDNFISLDTPIGFELGWNPAGNSQIQDVSLLWGIDSSLTFDENTILTTSSLGGNCNTSDIVEKVPECYKSFTSTSNTSFQTITLDCNIGGINAGNKFAYTVNGITTNVTYPYTVTPNRGSHYLTNTLNSIKGIQVIHYEFHPLERLYVIHLEIDVTIASLTSVVETTTFRSFSLSALNQIYHNITNEVNPYVGFNWTLPTISLSSPTGNINQMAGYVQDEPSIPLNAVSIEWDKTNDQFSIGKLFAANALTSYIFKLHEDYPTNTNQVWLGQLPPGVNSIDISGVETSLINNGSSLAAVNYFSYTNYIGWMYVFAVDMTLNDFDFIIDEATRRPSIWGTADNIKYIGDLTVLAPVVTSLIC